MTRIGYIVQRDDGALMISRRTLNEALMPVRSFEAPTLFENKAAAEFTIKITIQELGSYVAESFKLVPIAYPVVGVTLDDKPLTDRPKQRRNGPANGRRTATALRSDRRAAVS